jgi:plastocyanin
MTRGILTLAALASLAAAAFAGPVAAKTSQLTGQVGPGFTIEVKLGGKDVKTLKAGTYTIKVEDKSAMHNFHLIGPGVNKATSVSGTGEQIWTVKLRKGSYTYQCDPHASRGMKGSFRVT